MRDESNTRPCDLIAQNIELRRTVSLLSLMINTLATGVVRQRADDVQHGRLAPRDAAALLHKAVFDLAAFAEFEPSPRWTTQTLESIRASADHLRDIGRRVWGRADDAILIQGDPDFTWIQHTRCYKDALDERTAFRPIEAPDRPERGSARRSAPDQSEGRVRRPKGAKRAKLMRLCAERDGSEECSWCGSETNLHLDHIVPVSRGGTNDLPNLRILCFTCNMAKRDRMDDEVERP